VSAVVFEDEAGPGDEILDGRRYEDIGRPSQRSDPRPYVHSDTPYVVAGPLDLPGVQAGPDLDAEWPNGRDYRLAAANASGGAIERGQEAVTSCIHLDAAMERELRSHTPMVLLEKVPPANVPELGRTCRRADDVGE
jgi:hypothetical protein